MTGPTPDRLAAARRLTEAAGGRVPYPAREAADPTDAILLGAMELLCDPVWVAEHWITDDEGTDDDAT